MLDGEDARQGGLAERLAMLISFSITVEHRSQEFAESACRYTGTTEIGTLCVCLPERSTRSR
jgi:hypothetical protein